MSHHQRIFVVVLLLICGVSFGLYRRVLTQEKLEAMYTTCNKSNGRARVLCLQSLFTPYIRAANLHAFMQSIETSNVNHQDSSIPLALSCHDVGHIVGELASRSSESLVTLVGACGSSCESGCIHGVIAGRVRNSPTLLDRADTVCVGNRGQELLRIQTIACHHGLGHVFAELSGYRVVEALQHCDTLQETGAKSDCASGVFMEIFRPPLQSHSAQMMPNDVWAYCEKIPQNYRYKCIYDGAMVAYTSSNSIVAGKQICNRLPDVERMLCYKSIGSAVYAQEQADPKKVIVVCQQMGDAMVICVQGAIVQPLVIDPSGKTSLAICHAAPTEMRAACEEEVMLLKHDFNEPN